MTIAPPSSPVPHQILGFTEFVALMAATMALQAFAIDAMLPALPDIGSSFRVVDPNRLQWVVTAFLMGAGAGQILYGPLSDWLGRRRILLAGLGMYVGLSFLAALAPSLEWMLAFRVAQGIASASVGVIPRSIVRDRFEGPTMARVLSIIFMVFLLVPVLAPTLGQVLLLVMPWRGIFGVLGLAGAAVALWVALRLPETLHPEYRRVPRARALLEAGWFVVSERASLWYSLAATTMFGSVIAYVSTVPQLFSVTFRRPDLMSATFAFCAGGMGVAAFLNSRIVERVGMRRISHSAVVAFLVVNAIHSAIALRGTENVAVFAVFQALSLACVGLSVSNFTAIAMQSMGAIAGSAASIQGVITMIGGSLVASAIGQQWSGSVAYLPIGAFCCGLSALACALIAERGELFRNRYVAPPAPLEAGLDASAS